MAVPINMRKKPTSKQAKQRKARQHAVQHGEIPLLVHIYTLSISIVF